MNKTLSTLTILAVLTLTLADLAGVQGYSSRIWLRHCDTGPN